MGGGLKKALIISVAIASMLFICYSIYCVIVNRAIYWIGFIISIVLAIIPEIVFWRKFREIEKINLDGKNIEDM